MGGNLVWPNEPIISSCFSRYQLPKTKQLIHSQKFQDWAATCIQCCSHLLAYEVSVNFCWGPFVMPASRQSKCPFSPVEILIKLVFLCGLACRNYVSKSLPILQSSFGLSRYCFCTPFGLKFGNVSCICQALAIARMAGRSLVKASEKLVKDTCVVVVILKNLEHAV
jgi:hypothetical protein